MPSATGAALGAPVSRKPQRAPRASPAPADGDDLKPRRKRGPNRPLPVPEFASLDVLVTAREGAAVGRMGLSTFWLRVKEGRLPQPAAYIGVKSPRWRLRDLRAAMGLEG